MQIENLKVGMTIKNYKELCKLLEVDVKAGKSKQLQLTDFQRYFDYLKEGNKFIIKEIYNVPKVKVDNRINNKGGNNMKYSHILSDRELSDKFDGYYVYCHKINNEIIYIGKGCRRRAVKGDRPYNLNDVEKEIIRRFDNEIDALKYEQSLIKYYKSIHQCKYNDKIYHTGNHKSNYLKEIKFNIALNRRIDDMFKYSI